MSPTKNHLHLLLAAMRRYFAPGRSRGSHRETRIRPKKFDARDGKAVGPTGGVGGIGDQLARQGPIQITTVHGESMRTQDGITVQITAKLAWSSVLRSGAGPHQDAGWFAFDKAPGRHGDTMAQTLAREALRTTVQGCGLAALLCYRHRAEEQVRLDIARQGVAAGLIVHLVRLRAIEIPESVQVAGDARGLLAIRDCVEHYRIPNRRARANYGAAAAGHLAW